MTKKSDKGGKKTRSIISAQNVSRANKAENETLIDKTKIKNKQRKNRIRFYYSFLTVVLLICIAQIGFSAILNISKTISYKTKIATMKKTKNQAVERNKKLKEEIENFSSATSLEAIARNNLKMAGEDEVLVIINTAQEANSEKPDKKMHKAKKFKNNKIIGKNE